MPTPTYQIQPFGLASPHVPGIQRVYQAVWQHDAPLWLHAHAAYPGFRGLVALDDGGAVVGFAYGATDRPGQWWHEQIAPILGPERTARNLADSFVVIELAVLAAHRRHGLGRRLMRALLTDLPNAQATLSTQVNNVAARALYTDLGFIPLLEPLIFAGNAEPYVILHATLPNHSG
jgi:ribosomal protein S18 acetylase RimI-like enzyme